MKDAPITNDTLFKVLNDDGSCRHGGRGGWFLPNGKAGKWMPKLDETRLDPCSYGYHILKAEHLVEWLGPAIFAVEYKGKMVEETDKLVVGRARLIGRISRWNDRTARLFAADCAEHTLHLFERDYPDDDRPRKAIQAARDFANGKIDDAARDAAWAAARDAAWDAARDAAWAAAWDAAWAAARDAAWAAAWDAARDAAWDAAWAAARDAARDAAWDAARDAARAAAWDAAWDAARDAARAAARAAAWAAERQWQTERLLAYLTGEVE